MNKNNLRRIAVFMAMMATSPQKTSAMSNSITVAYGGPGYFEPIEPTVEYGGPDVFEKPGVLYGGPDFERPKFEEIDNKKFYKNPKIMGPAVAAGAVLLTGTILLSLRGAGIIGKKDKNKKSTDVGNNSRGKNYNKKKISDDKSQNIKYSMVAKNIIQEDVEEENKEDKNSDGIYWALYQKFINCKKITQVFSYKYKLNNNKRVAGGNITDNPKFTELINNDKLKFDDLKEIKRVFENASSKFAYLKCLTHGDNSYSWQRTFEKDNYYVNEFIQKLKFEGLQENKKTRIEIQDLDKNGVYVAIDQINENENEISTSTCETGNGLYFIIKGDN